MLWHKSEINSICISIFYWMHTSHFVIHLLVDGHLCCFYYGYYENYHYKHWCIFCQLCFHYSWYIQRCGISRPFVNSALTFWNIGRLLSNVAVAPHIPVRQVWSLPRIWRRCSLTAICHLMIAILVSMRWCLVVLIDTSQLLNLGQGKAVDLAGLVQP